MLKWKKGADLGMFARLTSRYSPKCLLSCSCAQRQFFNRKERVSRTGEVEREETLPDFRKVRAGLCSTRFLSPNQSSF